MCKGGKASITIVQVSDSGRYHGAAPIARSKTNRFVDKFLVIIVNDDWVAITCVKGETLDNIGG